MAYKKKSNGWLWMYIFAGVMDFIQLFIIELVLGWFGIGVAINEVLDLIVGGILVIWIQFIKKVSLIQRPQRLISLVGTEAAAALTGGIAQLWVLDVWYIHSDAKKEDAESEQQEMLKNWTPEWEKPAIQMNADGVPTHMPNIATSEEGGPINKRSTPPLNVGQVRMPSGKKHV